MNSTDGSTKRRHRKVYEPTEAEISERRDILDWLQSCGFSNRFIASIMQFDCPGIDLVSKLVRKYGVTETIRRLEPMLEHTEYDEEKE